MMIEKLGSYNSSRTSIDGIHWESHPNIEDVINKINEIIDTVNTPIVKAEIVRHGHWLWVDGVRCSICNYKLQTTGLTSYCPNCGAKMDGATYETNRC